MPGVSLNLDLPTLSDPLATIVAKLVTALNTVQTDLADKVVPSEINVNSAFSFAGNSLTSVGNVQMVGGNSAAGIPGAVWYQNGEFYCQDGTGTIQLTLAGALNASSIGGIVGLGATTAAVTYDLASQEFRFTAAPGTPADITCDDLVLNGAAGSIRLDVDAAITSARTFKFKSLPAAGISLLVYDASDSSLKDANATAPTNAVPTLTVGTLTTTADEKYTNYIRRNSMQFPTPDAVQCAAASQSLISSGGAWSWASNVLPCRAGDTVFSYGFYARTKTGSITVKLQEQDAVTGVVTTLDTTTFAATGAANYTRNVAIPVAVTALKRQFLAFNGNASGEVISDAYITYNRP